MNKQKLVEMIRQLKQTKQALIVAHYYVTDEVQDVADYIGDSYYLSKICMQRKEQLIVFCGVAFMGESAKILNPEKCIMMPNEKADCPMAHMIEIEKIQQIRQQYEDLAVVCYINSSAEIKALSDVIVTSANAYHIVNRLKEKNIFFIPDEHLGRYLAKQLPDKHFIFNDGFCHVHTNITQKELEAEMKKHPQAKVLVHPECPQEITQLADYIGSTSDIIRYATESESREFIIATEIGVFHELKKRNPDKTFYTIGKDFICPNMKRITLEDVYETLKSINETTDASKGIQVDNQIACSAKQALIRMHELGE